MASVATGDRRKRHSGASEENAPLRDYAALASLFNIFLAAFLFFNRRSDYETVSSGDVLLLGLATQKVSRVLTRDRVTQPLRRPFAEFERSAGSGEVEEKPRGVGLRRAIGELVTCPYCIGTWVASGFVYGFTLNPRLTRVVAGIFAIGSVADFAQQGYAMLKEAVE